MPRAALARPAVFLPAQRDSLDMFAYFSAPYNDAVSSAFGLVASHPMDCCALNVLAVLRGMAIEEGTRLSPMALGRGVLGTPATRDSLRYTNILSTTLPATSVSRKYRPWNL